MNFNWLDSCKKADTHSGPGQGGKGILVCVVQCKCFVTGA